MAKQKKSKMALYTRQDKIILYCGYALLGLFLLAIIVPMIYIVIASFMDPVTLQNKGISFDFSKWSLDATRESLDVSEENLTDAMSRIMDTDMASEMTEYTSNNVLSQAATSMLSQANNRPQQIMSLLQS